MTKRQAAILLADTASRMTEAYREDECSLALEYGDDDRVDEIDAECDRVLQRIDYLLGVLLDES